MKFYKNVLFLLPSTRSGSAAVRSLSMSKGTDSGVNDVNHRFSGQQEVSGGHVLEERLNAEEALLCQCC